MAALALKPKQSSYICIQKNVTCYIIHVALHVTHTCYTYMLHCAFTYRDQVLYVIDTNSTIKLFRGNTRACPWFTGLPTRSSKIKWHYTTTCMTMYVQYVRLLHKLCEVLVVSIILLCLEWFALEWFEVGTLL